MANKRMPNIGNSKAETSYPEPEGGAGSIASADNSLGSTGHNWNAANFVEDPDVYNDTPAKKKSYSWNKGETGNAT